MRLTLVLSVVVSCLAAASAIAQQRLVNLEHLRCVQDSDYVYLAQGDPVLIVFEKCPDPAGGEAAVLMSKAENSAFPAADDRTGVDGSPRAIRFARFTREEIECLAALELDTLPRAANDNTLLVLPDDVCQP